MFRHAAFDPGNIFWYPQTLELNPQWSALWLEALEQGGALVKAGRGDDSDFSERSLEPQLEHLRDRVHGELFKLPQAVHPSPSQRRIDSDARIEAILSNILAKWPQTVKTSPPDNAKPGNAKPDNIKMDQPPPSKKAVDGRVNEDGDYVETVILSANQLSAQSGKPGPRETAADGEKTVIMPPAKGQVPEKEAVNDLEETVLLKPHQESPAVPLSTGDALDQTVVIAPKPKHAGEGELDDTVIMSPEKQERLQEEELEETLIIHPSNEQRRKPEK
jgi:hypothetical protein